jgi:cysteine synthase A
MQADGTGLRLRRALSAKTGVATIPQLFIGGAFVGGCSETLDACRDGSLQARLKACGIEVQSPPGLEPYDLLPKWLHRRG